MGEMSLPASRQGSGRLNDYKSFLKWAVLLRRMGHLQIETMFLAALFSVTKDFRPRRHSGGGFRAATSENGAVAKFIFVTLILA
jgi:hypothetical protein